MGHAPKRQKFVSLQAGRGIAAVMVVLNHIGGYVGGEPGLWHHGGFTRWFRAGKYGVDFFFILSGIVILLAHRDELGDPTRFPSFLWKRFRRIYPIYWIFLIPTVLKQLYTVGSDAYHQREPFVILSSFLLIHIRSINYNLPPSWTLFHEVLFYLLFSILFLRKDLGVLLLSCWFAASFFFFTLDGISATPISYLVVLFTPLHLFFAFGLFIGWLLNRRRAPAQLWLLLSGLSVFFATLYLDSLHGKESAGMRILGGAGLALAVLIAAERERLQKLHVPPTLVFIGDASYSIYLVHFIVVSGIARKGFILDQKWHLPLTGWMTIMFVAAMSAGILVHLIIERPLLRWLSGPSRGVTDLNQTEPVPPEPDGLPVTPQ